MFEQEFENLEDILIGNVILQRESELQPDNEQLRKELEEASEMYENAKAEFLKKWNR